MERSKVVSYVEDAADRRNKIAALIAVMLVYQDTFEGESPAEICEAFGMATTYKHTLRSIVKAKDELYILGYKIVKVKDGKD